MKLYRNADTSPQEKSYRMATDYAQTKTLIEVVLAAPQRVAATDLDNRLEKMGFSRPQFFDGVIEHGAGMTFTDDQWFDFHLKIPHWRLLDEKSLMDKLSPIQREILFSR